MTLSKFYNPNLPASNYAKDSKLKPDAPEFFPLQPATPSGAVTKTISKLQKRLEKEIEKEQRRASLSKKSGKKTTKSAQPEGMG